ncbi:MAG: PAS domain-containing sensor histidine kinase [Mangrovibacterium sp.]
MDKSYLLNILFRILLIILVSFGIGSCFFSEQSFLICLVLLFVLVILVINLIHYQNKINEQINYFFEAVKNEDFSLIYPALKGDKILEKLNRNLNNVNQQIQQIKINYQQQEQYFRALLDHVGAGILTFDERGFVIHANNYVKRLLGMEQLTHLKQVEKVDPQLANLLRLIQQHEQKLVSFNGKRGQINILIKATAFRSKDQQLMLLSVQDINQELDEKELDSWLRLIRVLTHEIMNSIAPVTSLSESLSNYYMKDGKIISREEVNEKIIQNTIRGLEIIKEQGKGLIHFVELYRKFTRLPKPEKKSVEVDQLLEKTIVLNQNALSDGYVKHIIRIKGSGLQIMADENLISQVLNNLLKNALEALAETSDGEIELVAGKSERGQVEISVKDNGPGIPPDLINEIFVPFFTTRPNGNGIGLSLSRQIMRLHGGSLKVHSVPGRETVFTMVF